jgi:type IV secretion system protein VirD4
MFTNENARSYRTGDLFLGRDELNIEVGISTDRHAITIAGSRSGKGAGLIIPNLKRWPDNVLCIDPKGENAELTYQDREAMGQAVHVLDPFGSADVPDRIRAKFNPLASIDLTSNRARQDILDIANGLVISHDPKHMEWVEGARSLLAGIIAYVIADAPPEHRNFASVRNILMLPKETASGAMGLWDHAQAMTGDDRIGGLIRNAGVTLITGMESEKGMEKDFLGGARRATEWLDDEAIAECLSDSTFQFSDLKTGNASVFLVLPSDGTFLKTYGAFLRLFVKTALNAMGKHQKGKRCLFILDEFASLQKLDELVDAAGRLPSYGVHLWPFMQNLTQLYDLYGKEGAETFFGNSDAHIFFGNTDGTTLDYVSRRIGNFTSSDLATAPPIELPYIPFWKSKREAPRNKHLAEMENNRRVYDHHMKQVGTPRVPSDQVGDLVAKYDDNDVARGMIVFAKGSHRFYLQLAPYFAPIPSQTKATKFQPLNSYKIMMHGYTKAGAIFGLGMAVPFMVGVLSGGLLRFIGVPETIVLLPVQIAVYAMIPFALFNWFMWTIAHSDRN